MGDAVQHTVSFNTLQAPEMSCVGCRYKGAGVKVQHYEYMHHNHAGVVSLSGDASEVAITFTKALYLDSSYQVASDVHVSFILLSFQEACLAAAQPHGIYLEGTAINQCRLEWRDFCRLLAGRTKAWISFRS